MTNEEVMVTPPDTVCLMADGKFALLILYPVQGSQGCGFQVPMSDEDIRWCAADRLTNNLGAMRQEGSPFLPKTPTDPLQKTLYQAWLAGVVL